MNLHSIAGPIVAAVNPWVAASYYVSTGNGVADDGSRQALFADPVGVLAQMQPMTAKDLEQVSGLNITGTKRAFYLDGDRRGVSRPDVKGGDMITIGATFWLVVMELENWSLTAGWSKVAAVQQNKGPLC